MMIYMGEPLVDWEAELLSHAILKGNPPEVNQLMFIEQDFTKKKE